MRRAFLHGLLATVLATALQPAMAAAPAAMPANGSAAQDGLAGAVFHYAADGFTTGRVHGCEVRCLSAAQQLAFRDGYQWREVDRHDVTLLRAHTAR